MTRIGGQQPKKKLGPASSDILVQAQVYEPAWTAAVVGQVTNDHPTMLLRSTQISAVVYDSAGNIIGGSQGGTYGAMLPGVRSYFAGVERRRRDPVRPRRGCERLRARHVRGTELEERFRSGVLRPITSA